MYNIPGTQIRKFIFRSTELAIANQRFREKIRSALLHNVLRLVFAIT